MTPSLHFVDRPNIKKEKRENTWRAHVEGPGSFPRIRPAQDNQPPQDRPDSNLLYQIRLNVALQIRLSPPERPLYIRIRTSLQIYRRAHFGTLARSFPQRPVPPITAVRPYRPFPSVPSGQERRAMAPIAVGDAIPDGTLAYFDEQDQLQQVSVHSLAAGKKAVLFAVPGAFTPTCR